MFLNAFDDRAQLFSWGNILDIPTATGIKNLVREHGQISTKEVTDHVATYASGANRQAQNCVMMYACLRQSVAATKLADLEGDLQEFTQQGPTFLKYIIKEANNDTAAAAISVSMNMIELDKTMNSLQHDVKSFNVHCQGQFRIRDQLGQPISNTDGIAYLAKGYKEVPVAQFNTYVESKMNDHSDGSKPLTVKELMTITTIKYNDLVRAGHWNLQPSVDVVALQCQVDGLKAALTMAKKPKTKDAKTKKKKDTPFTLEAWATKPPLDGVMTMVKNSKTFHWCSWHGRWCNHTVADCKAKGRTGGDQSDVAANAAEVEEHELSGYFSEDSQN